MSSAQPFSDVERYHFDLYGYVVRREALDEDELTAALDGVRRMALPAPGDSIQSQRFSGFLERQQVFRDLLDHDAVLEPLIEMCGPTVRLDYAYGIIMAGGTSGLGLHGGGTPHDPAQFYDVRGGRMRNGLVGVQGSIPVAFADYEIANPSFGGVSTQDNGLVEFVLVFQQV